MLLNRKNIMTDVNEADNGQKAIDIIYANISFYQLIFMDNFMPLLVNIITILILYILKLSNVLVFFLGWYGCNQTTS